jgi:hypothetical protein
MIRFFLRALPANGEAGFARAVYAIRTVLVAPFQLVCSVRHKSDRRDAEVSTVRAMVYAGIGWLLARAA